MCTSLNVPEEEGTSRLDNASNLRLYQSVELPKSRIWFRQIGDYENVEDRGITGPTPKTISQSQTFISSPRSSGTLKSKSHLNRSPNQKGIDQPLNSEPLKMQAMASIFLFLVWSPRSMDQREVKER
jgi:hypothetical protein